MQTSNFLISLFKACFKMVAGILDFASKVKVNNQIAVMRNGTVKLIDRETKKRDDIIATGYNVLCFLASYIVRKFLFARLSYIPIDLYNVSRIQYEALLSLDNKTNNQEYILDLQSEVISILFEYATKKDYEGGIKASFKNLSIIRDDFEAKNNKRAVQEPILDVALLAEFHDLIEGVKTSETWIDYKNEKFVNALIDLFNQTKKEHSRLEFKTFEYILANYKLCDIAKSLGVSTSTISQKKGKYIDYLYKTANENAVKYKPLFDAGLIREKDEKDD